MQNMGFKSEKRENSRRVLLTSQTKVLSLYRCQIDVDEQQSDESGPVNQSHSYPIMSPFGAAASYHSVKTIS